MSSTGIVEFLTMKWGLLCPNCRGAKISVATLSELPRGAHCQSCNIDYDRDFERNVELSFTPAPAVRPLMVGGYCLSGPMATPHVPVQLLLSPGERRTIDLGQLSFEHAVDIVRIERRLHQVGIAVKVEAVGMQHECRAARRGRSGDAGGYTRGRTPGRSGGHPEWSQTGRDIEAGTSRS